MWHSFLMINIEFKKNLLVFKKFLRNIKTNYAKPKLKKNIFDSKIRILC